MSSTECLREFVNKRLTAAAEEIFGVFRKTIVDFEEEIARQRRQLDIAWKPEIKFHGIDLPQQHVCKQDEVLCVQERSSILDQEDPQPPQIKEEQEDLCTSQEGEQLGLKQDTDALMLTPTKGESNHIEDQTVCLNPANTLHEAEEQSNVRMPFIISVVSESDRDHQLLSNSSHSAESRDQKGDEHGDSGSTRNTGPRQTKTTEPKPKKRPHESKSHTTNEHNSTRSKMQPYYNTGNKSPECDICLKTFSSQSALTLHLITHTGEKPFLCKNCGKAFRYKGDMTRHMRIHTGEKAFTCETCGRNFGHSSHLTVHKRRAHTGEKPHLCKTCGRGFPSKSQLTRHMRTHTGEKPHSCSICGKQYSQRYDLKVHLKSHANEKAVK